MARNLWIPKQDENNLGTRTSFRLNSVVQMIWFEILRAHEVNAQFNQLYSLQINPLAWNWRKWKQLRLTFHLASNIERI